MAYETILFERRDQIAYITLNRPDRANTISAQLMHDMLGAVDNVEADKETRVIIVTGAGERHFCGGADLRDPAILGGKRDAFPDRDFMTALENCRVPVIGAINGAAMGGGCEIALACDIRVIAESASIGLPEIKFGALPAGGGTQRLPRLVGSAVAKELIFGGLAITPAEALRVGLVNRVVPYANLMTACEEIANIYKQRAAYALKAAKRLINEGIELPLEEALKFEHKAIAAMATAEERRQAREEAAASQKTYARIFSDKK